MENDEMYAHFFLFRCGACRGYLATVCASPQRNLEPTDAHNFALRCTCGWSGELPGAAAMRHWVDLGEHIDLKDLPEGSITWNAAA